ncbi:hypothetical protein Mgra_00008241 [Meloidogyne graminicola]|uniref:Uncharacterized protein n=1 Tax=Meloidogyne graminicola TaxID=189291 RepID=A0A8S9ZG88_9BILA|nr:hypothetical protein Mgra_00008241 [Meloidogyne graminicola]
MPTKYVSLYHQPHCCPSHLQYSLFYSQPLTKSRHSANEAILTLPNNPFHFRHRNSLQLSSDSFGFVGVSSIVPNPLRFVPGGGAILLRPEVVRKVCCPFRAFPPFFWGE